MAKGPSGRPRQSAGAVTAGKASGDKDTENEGKVDQVKANLKDAGEKVKDAFK